jgi:hypothetical protein
MKTDPRPPAPDPRPLIADVIANAIANAILGIDTLWGGDVMCPSGTGRFIADSWFSDEPLPPLTPHPTAARVRESGGVSAKSPDGKRSPPISPPWMCWAPSADSLRKPRPCAGLRGEYLRGLALCFETMWDLAMEMLAKGEPVPYDRCVDGLHRPAAFAVGSHSQARTRRGVAGARRISIAHRRRIAGRGGRLAQSALRSHGRHPRLGAAVIAQYDALSAAQLAPHLPAEMQACRAPTSNSCPSRTPGFPDR